MPVEQVTVPMGFPWLAHSLQTSDLDYKTLLELSPEFPVNSVFCLPRHSDSTLSFSVLLAATGHPQF